MSSWPTTAMGTTTDTNDSVHPMTLHSSIITRHAGGFAYPLCPVSTFFTCTHSYSNSLFSGARNRSNSMSRCFVFPRTATSQLTLPPILPMFAHIRTVFLAHCIPSSFFTPALLSRITHCLLTSSLLFGSSHANVIFLSVKIDSIDPSGQSRFFFLCFHLFYFHQLPMLNSTAGRYI